MTARLWPDAEQHAMDRIAAVTGHAASTGVPLGEGVRVMRTGTAARNRGGIDAPILTLDAYAATETRALEVLDEVEASLLTWSGQQSWGYIKQAWHVGGPSNDPDPDTKAVRYTAMVGLRYRATPRRP